MGKLINANKEEFRQIIESEKDLVLVDFWAEWCGPCRMLGPMLHEIADEMNITVVKINVDENDNSALSAEMGVRGIPAVFVFKGGQQVDKFIGALPKNKIVEVINRHIDSTDEPKN